MDLKKYLGVIALIGLFFINSGEVKADEQNKGVQIKNYEIVVTNDDQGQITEEEIIRYRFQKQVDQISHYIGLGEGGKLSHLAVDMKTDSADQPFPFVESSSHTVGTFSLSKDGKNTKVSLYNTMSGDDEVTHYQSVISEAWMRYDQSVILQKEFALAPFDVDQVTLTFKFPKSVDKSQFKVWLESKASYTSYFKDDQTYVVKMTDRSAHAPLHVTMVLPAEYMPHTSGEGPKSKGEQIIQELDKKTQEKEQAHRKLWWQLRGLVIFVVLLVGAYTVSFLKYKKLPLEDEANVYVPALRPIEVAKVLKIRKASEDYLWLIIYELVHKNLLSLEFQESKGHFRPIIRVKSTVTDNPVESIVLACFQKVSKGQWFDYLIFKTGEQSVHSHKQTLAYKTLLKDIRQAIKQQMKAWQLEDVRGTISFSTFWLVNILITLCSFLYSLRLSFQLHGGYVWVGVLLILLGLEIVIGRYSFPVYNATGRKTQAKYKKYFRTMKKKASKTDRDLLYSFISNRSHACYQAMTNQGGSYGPLYQALSGIEGRDFRKMK